MEIKYDKVSYVSTDNATYIKTILSNVDLEIKEKNITAIMGKCESGKSTLIGMLDGLVNPTKGEVIVDPNNKIGIVFQNSSELFFMDTVLKELAFTIKHMNKKVKNIEKHMNDSLIMVGLNERYLNRSIDSLSSGEKKKLALALVLSINPKIIVLDEPTINLDNEGIDNLISLIKRLKTTYDKTIIIVSKDSDFVHKIADKVVILNEGKVVLSGNKYDVFIQNIEKYGLRKPKIIEFEQLVRDKKKIRLLYRDEINDLMKDIYRYVEK